MNIYIKKYLIEFKCAHKGYNKTSPCDARTCLLVFQMSIPFGLNLFRPEFVTIQFAIHAENPRFSPVY